MVLRVLLIIALACYAVFYALRCPISPPISLNTIMLSAVMFAASLFLFYCILEEMIPKGSKLWAFGIGLYLAAIIFAGNALLFSDSIGKPNWHRSIGRQCFL